MNAGTPNANTPAPETAGQAGGASPSTEPPAAPHVAALLPLTGPNAALGQALLHAAQLALDAPGAPTLDPRDTGGTPDGAAAAARAAQAAGDKLFLGPLTATETGAAAPIATAAAIPMLAFTSDPAQARPGLWILGLTPAQQVRRMVAAAQAAGHTRFAALLPDGAFGTALADGLVAALSGTPPDIHRYSGPVSKAADALAQMTGHPKQPDANAASAASAPPLPFDTLLLAESGSRMQQLLPALAANGITADQVRVLGPALWAADAPRLSQIAGAWYAAPDPALRTTYEAKYRARFAAAPPALSDLGYDAASLARVLAAGPGFTPQAITQPEGFAGVDGVFGLLPDGHVKRGLALFEVGHGPAQLVQPSPATVTGPGM